jgi:hypothetical protein
LGSQQSLPIKLNDYYNFVRIRKTLKVTPATAAGVTDRLWEVADMLSVLEAWEANNHCR